MQGAVLESGVSDAERFKTARKRMRLTQQEVADNLGVSRETVAAYEAGRVKVPAKAFSSLMAMDTGVNMLDRPRIPVTFDPQPMRYAGEVPAGDWGDPLASEDFIDVDPALFHAKRYAAKVVGPSCYPALHPGDLVIWHHDESPPYGMLVLAQRKEDHACTVKVLDWDAETNQPVLRPVNPDHEPAGSDGGWVAIARLVAVIRKIDGLEMRWFLPEGIRPRHLTSHS